MKKRQRLLAALTAAGMTAAAVPAVAVFADDSVAVTPSKYLQDQKGTLTMTVSGDRDVRVKIEKDTLDGVITYYDTTLENDGTYDFTLDSRQRVGQGRQQLFLYRRTSGRHGSGLYPECGTEPV